MIDKDFLQKEYIDNKRTAKDIGLEINLSDTQVRYWLRKYNLPIRPRGGTSKTKNLINKEFGSLKVLSQTRGDGVSAIWNCECVCGNLTKVRAPCLRRHEITSCGKCKEHYNWKGVGELSGQYFATLKTGASKRNLIFDITKDFLWDLFLKQNRLCKLSGIKLHFARSYGSTEQTASLDRIDNDVGYIESNVQWVHKDLNRIKREFNQDVFLNYVKLIYEYRKL